MRGTVRSIRYWIYTMEKVYGVMYLTVAAVLAFQCITNGMQVLFDMARMYFPMMGSLFLIAVMMSSANHYIPQSLSSGGTRKEIYIGMQLSAHLMICQTLLLAVIVGILMPTGFADGRFLLGCTAFYLLFSGVGNLLCAGSLRFGTRIGMIVYVILVIVAATVIGVLAVFEKVTLFDGVAIGYGVAAAAVVDLLMMAVCYFAIRRYEVR